jgi:hypothetical protein
VDGPRVQPSHFAMRRQSGRRRERPRNPAELFGVHGDLGESNWS